MEETKLTGLEKQDATSFLSPVKRVNARTPHPSKKVKFGNTSPSLSKMSSTTSYISYLQQVTEIQQSKRSSNLYYDIVLQTAEDKAKVIRVMQQRGDGGRRQFFINKMKVQQPIRISNLPLHSSSTIFLNHGSVVQDVSCHSVQFQLIDAKLEGVIKISDILKCTSGTFTMSGSVSWSGPAHAPTDNSPKSVREGTLTDNSGSINISIWEDQIDQIQEGKFYRISNCKLRYFYGKCLATTKTTTITDAEEQDISTVEKKSLRISHVVQK